MSGAEIGGLVLDGARFVIMAAGGWQLGVWCGRLLWPRTPSVERAVVHVRNNVFVNADPELLVTVNDDGEAEIEGYAIMPADHYFEMANRLGEAHS